MSNGLSARHAFILCKNGSLFADGNNADGQFGNGKKSAKSRTRLSTFPHKIETSTFVNENDRIKQIECGW